MLSLGWTSGSWWKGATLGLYRNSEVSAFSNPGLNPSAAHQSVLRSIDSSRGAGRERRKRQRSRSTKWVERSIFSCTFDATPRTSISLWFYVCDYLAFGQRVGKGFLKIAHSLWHKAVWAWKADCCKPLIQAAGLSSHKDHAMTLPAPAWLCWWAGVTSRFQQWYLLHLRTTMFLHLV